jgi:DNA modification methylase
MSLPHKKVSTIAEIDHKVESSLAITYRDIQELKPNPQNPRVHSKKQIQQLANSIKHLGFNVPVLINRKLQIVAGHGRAEAAKVVGMSRIPTILLDHLSEAQLRAFMIADNQLTDQSTWDEHLLAEQFKILSDLDLDFSPEVTGFEMGEIDVMLEGFTSASKGGKDAADELPELNSGTRVAQQGDVWLLGRHRLACGDALDEQGYPLLMENRRAAAVFTDPPYNDPIDGFVTRSGKTRHLKFAMAAGELSKEEFTEFLHKCFCLLLRNSDPGALHFICMDWRHSPELLTAADRVFAEFKNLCVWVKDTGGQGSLYRSQHELVFVFKGGKTRHRNNVQLGKYGRYRTNVWQYPRVNSFGKTNPEGEFTVLHPTVKPVSLVADAVLDSTARGDIVLDPFLGSGTTLIAAERVGRICYGIELTPAYVDLAIRRWQSFTGQAAVHCQSRQPFREREEVAGEKRQSE